MMDFIDLPVHSKSCRKLVQVGTFGLSATQPRSANTMGIFLGNYLFFDLYWHCFVFHLLSEILFLTA